MLTRVSNRPLAVISRRLPAVWTAILPDIVTCALSADCPRSTKLVYSGVAILYAVFSLVDGSRVSRETSGALVRVTTDFVTWLEQPPWDLDGRQNFRPTVIQRYMIRTKWTYWSRKAAAHEPVSRRSDENADTGWHRLVRRALPIVDDVADRGFASKISVTTNTAERTGHSLSIEADTFENASNARSPSRTQCS